VIHLSWIFWIVCTELIILEGGIEGCSFDRFLAIHALNLGRSAELTNIDAVKIRVFKDGDPRAP
jgi:hypothetical protein